MKPLSAAIVASILMAIRAGDSFLHPQFFSEDSVVFFAQQKLLGWAAIFEYYAGYLCTAQRLVAVVAGWLPAAIAPNVFVWADITLAAWTAATIATTNTRLALLYGFLLCMPPHSGELFALLTNIQWLLAIGLAFVVITADPISGLVRANQIIFVILAGFSGPFSILTAPLAAWRIYSQRTWFSALLGILVLASGIVQLWISSRGTPIGWPSSPPDPLHLAYIFTERIFGMLNYGRYSYSLFWLGLAILLAAVSLSIVLLKEERSLFVGLWVFAALVASAAYLRLWNMPHYLDWPNVWDRYFYIPRYVILASLITLVLRAGRYHFVFACVTLLSFVLLRYNWNGEPPHNWLVREKVPPKAWKEFGWMIDAGLAVSIPVNPQGTVFQLPSKPGLR